MEPELQRLYSPREVVEMFPVGHRPSLRRVISTAKVAGCCCKLGKGIAFTRKQVDEFISYISAPTAVMMGSARETAPSRRPGDAYNRVLNRLQAKSQTAPKRRPPESFGHLGKTNKT